MEASFVLRPSFSSSTTRFLDQLTMRSVISCFVREVTNRGDSGSPSRRMDSLGIGRPHSTSGHTGIFHILPQGVREKTVQLVPSVIPDFFSQQTGADPELNLFHGQCLLASKTRNEKRCPSFVIQIFKTEFLLQFLFFDKFDID